MAKFLTTNGISLKIEDIIKGAKKKLILVSPYLQISKTFYERLKDATNKGVVIKIIYGKDNLESIEIESDDKDIKKLDTDYILGFFGLIMQLGPIAHWGLNIDKKTIAVDTEKFETNQKGIYAIGDICNYPGKLKLILSGFHEGALAARGCFKYARPNEKYRFEFTTASNTIKDRLGVK